MKSVLLSLLAVFCLFVMVASPIIAKHALAFFKDLAQSLKFGPAQFGFRLRQAGFVTLLRPYAGYAQGTVVELPYSTETALIAAGQATASDGPSTAGAVTTTALQGSCTIAAGSSSIVITNSNVKKQSVIWAVVAQATADGTLLRVERVVAADGSFTIYGTANATAATVIDWAVLNPNGSLSNPQ